MPQPSRGPRLRVTARLPVDVFREAALRASQRGWSMSDYISFCVSREIQGQKKPSRVATGTPAYVTLPDFDDE